MNSGKILAAEYDRIPVLKLVGDVRVLMSSTIDNYFHTLYSRAILDAMIVDLSETRGIDSTALGLLAKMAIQLRNRFNVKPSIISTNPDITKILKGMSFDIIFDIVEEPFAEEAEFGELNPISEPDEAIKKKVIVAHQALMTLSEENKLEFQDLVSALKNN
ncbi:MAG: anti-anti-sigma factor [Gammaproteobacteria bacterium]|nr:anti-anti-sigma factor [Gammaproteobacteria bacterium]MAY01433.1 anti-anti-sigma factor [Gammaproteobacteria bacterium]|tara:strand:- start:90 stop:572 length:483 start_codon:yes stop_codon:yes gene_type:complete